LSWTIAQRVDSREGDGEVLLIERLDQLALGVLVVGEQDLPPPEHLPDALLKLNSDHNGRGTIENLTASVTAPSPPPTAQEVGCGGTGNTKWTVVLNTLTATAAHLEITQGGSTVFCRNYTLGGPATGTPC
jgi:hypothetical protein